MKKLMTVAAIMFPLSIAPLTVAEQPTNHLVAAKVVTTATTTLEKNEQQAIEALKLFHSVQITYQAREGQGKFATVEDLFRAAYIDGALSNATGCPALTEPTYKNKCAGDGAALNGYNFRIFLQQDAAGKPHFVVIASPALTTGENRHQVKSFLVDETGEIKILTTIPKNSTNN